MRFQGKAVAPGTLAFLRYHQVLVLLVKELGLHSKANATRPVDWCYVRHSCRLERAYKKRKEEMKRSIKKQEEVWDRMEL